MVTVVVISLEVPQNYAHAKSWLDESYFELNVLIQVSTVAVNMLLPVSTPLHKPQLTGVYSKPATYMLPRVN